MATEITLANYEAFDTETALSIYLFGEQRAQVEFCDRIRDIPAGSLGTTVHMDMSSYMTTGAGRYAHAAGAGVVQKFFDTTYAIADGTYSLTEMRSIMGLPETSQNFDVSQYTTDITSADYATRALLYGSTSFRIESAQFVVSGGQRTINSMDVIAFDDNFDFVSSSTIAQVAKVLLEPMIDPYLIGRRIDIDWTGNGRTMSGYTAADFASETAAITAESSSYFAAVDKLATVVAPLFALSLALTPELNYFHNGVEVFYGSPSDDLLTIPTGGFEQFNPAILVGGLGNDTVIGGTSDDELHGCAGFDTLMGGAGSDLLVGEGENDILSGNITTSLFSTADPKKPTSDGINDTLDGGLGHDSYYLNEDPVQLAFDGLEANVRTKSDLIIDADGLGAITFKSLDGEYINISRLTFVVAPPDSSAAYIDDREVTVSYFAAHDIGFGEIAIVYGEDRNVLFITKATVPPPNQRGGTGGPSSFLGIRFTDRMVELDGTAAAETITGTSDDDFIHAFGNVDQVLAGLGIDVVDGGDGNDILRGGDGADDLKGKLGNDQVFGEDGDDDCYGGDGTDTLTGGLGDDWLAGGSGADSMAGGIGNDRFWVDISGDVVTELANEGTDEIVASFSYTLASNFENLTLDGSAALAGTGNSVANVMVGNDAANTLQGLAGNDTLNGAGGANTMAGGTGNDSYVVDLAADNVTEAAAEGYDTVQTTLSSYTLGANFEELRFTGTGNFTGKGNALTNKLYGAAGNDYFTADGAGSDQFGGFDGLDTVDYRLLAGATINLLTNVHGGSATGHAYNAIERIFGSNAGADTITGGGREAIYSGFIGNDILHGGTQADTLNGNDGNDTLAGNLGNDVLWGGKNNDGLNGGAGSDTFVFGETVASGGWGADTITGFEDGLDKLKFDDAVAANFAAFTVTGNNTATVVLTLIAASANTITLQSAGGSINLTASDVVLF